MVIRTAGNHRIHPVSDLTGVAGPQDNRTELNRKGLCSGSGSRCLTARVWHLMGTLWCQCLPLQCAIRVLPRTSFGFNTFIDYHPLD